MGIIVATLATSSNCLVFADSVPATTSGVASTMNKIRVRGCNTAKGEAIGATETTSVYSAADDTSAVLNLVIKNQIIRSLGVENGFYKIKYGTGFGYVKQDFFIKGDDLAKYIVQNPNWFVKSVKVTSDSANLYDWLGGACIHTAVCGDTYQLSQDDGDNYVVVYTETSEGGTETNTLVKIAKSQCKVTTTLHITSFESTGDTVQPTVSEDEMNLVDYACQFVGNPYVWGGTDPNTGADCSGFVQYVYRHFGYELPRVSYQQATAGTEVSLDELQPGDLLFYNRDGQIGHVAIYIGDGQTVQARGTAYGICITNLADSKPVTARRILN